MRVVFGGFALFLVAVSVATSSGAETRYFRQRGGVASADHALPNDFDKDAVVRWRTKLPPGNSTPCVHGDSIYLTTWDPAKRELATVAVRRDNGAIRWKQVAEFEKLERFHPVGSPASCSPACNGKQLFVFFGSRGLLCYDLQGKLLWERRMGPFQDEFGASSSPILADGLVLISQDHDVDGFLMAIDQRTGKTVWKTSRAEFTRSYSTPIIVEGSSGKEVVVAGSLQLAGYDLATGKKRWWVNKLSRIVDSTPSVVGDHIYLATWTPGGDTQNRISMAPFADALARHDKSGDGKIEKSELPNGSPVAARFFRIDLNQDQKLDKAEWERHATVFARAQNVAMAVKTGGRGDVTDTHVKWVHRRGLPTVPSSLVYRGVLYMVRDSGIITSLDADTGKLLQQGRARGRGNYYASIVAGDGKVYLASERGVITVLAVDGKKWKIVSSHDFGQRIMATPVIEGGQFLLRTDQGLHCYAKKSP